MRLTWALGVTLLLVAGAGPSAVGETARPASPHPGLREEPLTQYRAFRRMHAKSERFDQEGWLDAWTEFDGGGFRYEIVSERGSEHVRNKVLKAVLKREQELATTGEGARAALTAANYEFVEPDVQQDGEKVVLLKPRRKDTLLVDGRMVLSPEGELRRVEGKLAKNPSFWTSLVRIIRHYARVDGVRVPIATESVAKVKFIGTSHLDVRYEYETINGRPLSASARAMLASNSLR